MSSGNTLHRIANTVMVQFDLYRELASVEWRAEQSRLTAMLINLLLGFTFFLCLLLALSSMVLIFSWDTQYRHWAMSALVCFHGLGVLLAWYRLKKLGTQSNQAFSDTREELVADMALIRKRLNQ